MMQKKTDNSHIEPKLALRRYFLDKYHAETKPVVLDCCAGSGMIWGELRKGYDVTYVGCDKKPIIGLINADSVRVLKASANAYDVIDVDTYGRPWAHWVEIIRDRRKPVTVFLTIGRLRMNGTIILSNMELEKTGIKFNKIDKLRGLTGKLHDYVDRIMLALPLEKNLIIVEAVEAYPQQTARYIGIRLMPKELNNVRSNGNRLDGSHV